MYLGVKWEDSRIRNMNQTVEDLQVMMMMMMKMLMMAMVILRMMMAMMVIMVTMMKMLMMIRMIEINNHYYLHLQVLLCRALAFHSFPFCGSQTSRSTM